MGEVGAIVPLPSTFIGNKVAAFGPVAGQAPLARVLRTMISGLSGPGDAVVAAARALIDDVRECLGAHDLSTVGLVVSGDHADRAGCVTSALEFLAETPRMRKRQGSCGPWLTAPAIAATPTRGCSFLVRRAWR